MIARARSPWPPAWSCRCARPQRGPRARARSCRPPGRPRSAAAIPHPLARDRDLRSTLQAPAAARATLSDRRTARADHTSRPHGCKTRGETLGNPPLRGRRCVRMIRSMPTISERNKARVQFFVEAVWNEGRLELIDDLVAADYMEHLSCLNMAVLGPDGVRTLVSSRRSVHPDLYVKIDDDIAEHDLVAVRWRATGAPDCSAQGSRSSGSSPASSSTPTRRSGRQHRVSPYESLLSQSTASQGADERWHVTFDAVRSRS